MIRFSNCDRLFRIDKFSAAGVFGTNATSILSLNVYYWATVILTLINDCTYLMLDAILWLKSSKIIIAFHMT